MVDAGDALNPAKAHTIERHLDTEVKDLRTVTLRRRVLPKLAMAVSANKAIFAVAMSIFYYFVTGTARAVHSSIPNYHFLLCNTINFSI